MKISKKFFFIGSGNMAQAIIRGLIEANFVEAENIVCNDIVKEKVLNIQQRFGVSIAKDKRKAIIEADIIFLSVEPQNVFKVFDEIRNFIKRKTVIISIAAGITTKFIEDDVKKDVAVIRAMPNIPALVRSGVTALCKGRFVSNDQFQKAKSLFSSVGKVEVLDERNFDIITSLSGSGPAYIFYFCELMQEAAEKLGLNKKVAEIFVVQTVYGSGKLLEMTRKSAKALKEKVKSPNGTTAAALECFEDHDLQNIVYEAMKQAMNRSRELSK
ncbi:MAG: pyrroline-5-carboxylate reductase [Endomicrobium sp.]|nr:pyrroline-5-carboxylate reductase [Endomicrobium sp.]